MPMRDLSGPRQRLAAALAEGKRLALFLDYDGTLRELVRDPSAAAPTPEVRHMLDRLALCGERRMDVTIISGRTPDDLESFLGAYGMFGLIAEHGAAIRRPGSRQWEQLDANVSYAWKEHVRKILRLYEDSTPGTHIEDKRTSLVWHYRRADPEFGAWKSRQLVEELSVVAANDPIVIAHGNKIVEVTAQQVNKGAAVTTLLSEGKYDLVVIAGDDTTDESMFRLEQALCPDVITIHVGERETRAQYRLSRPADLRRFVMEALGAA
jgi:trehalose 6-phosphate synthase/phosphatase